MSISFKNVCKEHAVKPFMIWCWCCLFLISGVYKTYSAFKPLFYVIFICHHVEIRRQAREEEVSQGQ